MTYLPNGNAPKRAILYTRVSTDEQAEKGYSLRAQEERLRTYCQIKNIIVIEHYQDDASAKTFNRPAFSQLLQYMKEHKNAVDLLLFIKWDRFSRNTSEAYQMIDRLLRSGVDAQAIEQPLDMFIPESRLMLAFYLAAPQVENERRSLNIIDGIRRAAREGRKTSGAPKGYKPSRDEQNKPLLVFNSDAPYIREAFTEMAKGIYTREEIRRRLCEKGFKCGKSQFHRLLSNPFYAGTITIAAWRGEPEKTVKGLHEPIINEELFNSVQDVLENRKGARRGKTASKHETLPLRGHLQCPKCGGNLTGSRSKGHGGAYYYYHCQHGCDTRIRADVANTEFVNYLKSLAISREAAEMYLDVMEDIFKEKEGDRKIAMINLDAEIRQIEEKLLNADEKFVEEQLAADSYQRLKENYTNKRKELERRRGELTGTDSNFMKYARFGLSLFSQLPECFANSPLETKQKLVSSIFPEKLIFENGNYRTSKMNEALALLTNGDGTGRGNKKGLPRLSREKSLKVARTGIEPVSQP